MRSFWKSGANFGCYHLIFDPGPLSPAKKKKNLK